MGVGIEDMCGSIATITVYERETSLDSFFKHKHTLHKILGRVFVTIVVDVIRYQSVVVVVCGLLLSFAAS